MWMALAKHLPGIVGLKIYLRRRGDLAQLWHLCVNICDDGDGPGSVRQPRNIAAHFQCGYQPRGATLRRQPHTIENILIAWRVAIGIDVSIDKLQAPPLLLGQARPHSPASFALALNSPASFAFADSMRISRL